MKYSMHLHQGQLKNPPTQAFKLLDDQLVIFLRGWGSQDYNQKFVDEITHFLSTAQADIEVTSPFDYLESLSSLANKVRIALLLAHDYFYKSENKTFFSIGFETTILMRQKKELAWGTVGRFSIHQVDSQQGLHVLSDVCTDRDKYILLPIELLGVEKDVEIRCGSFHVEQKNFIVSSCYNTPLTTELIQDERASSGINSNYWFSKIALD